MLNKNGVYCIATTYTSWDPTKYINLDKYLIIYNDNMKIREHSPLRHWADFNLRPNNVLPWDLCMHSVHQNGSISVII